MANASRAAFLELINALPESMQQRALDLLNSVAFKSEIPEDVLAGPDHTRDDSRFSVVSGAGGGGGATGLHAFAFRAQPTIPVNTTTTITFTETFIDTDGYNNSGSIVVPVTLGGTYMIGAWGFFDCGTGTIGSWSRAASITVSPGGTGYDDLIFQGHWREGFNARAHPSGSGAVKVNGGGGITVKAWYDTGGPTAGVRIVVVGLRLG